ncbi:hypothetical protein BJX70DRAFT_396337 [Aspergillus crustosus]
MVLIGLRLSLTVGLLSLALAQQCFPSRPWTFILNVEQSISEVTQNCTTLVENVNLELASNQGAEFGRITNVTGTVPLSNSSRQLTSIELPDLEYAGEIVLQGLPVLDRLSMPKLRVVGKLNVTLPSGSIASFDLRAWESAQEISLRGDFPTDVTFPSLREVNGRFTLGHEHTSWEEYDSGKPDVKSPVNYTFPLLEQVNGEFDIRRNFLGFSAPRLANIGNLIMKSLGEPLDLSFPALRAVGRFQLHNNFARIETPVQLSAESLEFSIRCKQDGLTLYSPIEACDPITIQGPVKSLRFPNLKTFRALIVDTDSPFSCQDFEKGLEVTAGDLDVVGSRGYRCRGGSIPLSTGAKAGIGIAAAIGGIALIALVVWWWRRETKKKKYRVPDAKS